MRTTKKKDQDLTNRLARALADYDNLVKRFEKERQEITLRATESLLKDLLPVIDSLERAQEHLKDQGLGMALDYLYQVLAEYGVKAVDVRVGDEFDESLHEALEAVPGAKQGTVAKVLAKGYRWTDGRVLRPAKVAVYGERVEYV